MRLLVIDKAFVLMKKLSTEEKIMNADIDLFYKK